MLKIRYIKNEFRFGITEYKTPCPFGMRDRYALQEIAGNYKISIHTRIINTAVKVIGIKIDNMNFNCD